VSAICLHRKTASFPSGTSDISHTLFKTVHGWMLMLLCIGFEVIELPPELRF